ncbi:MAG: hypothetical protein KC583_22050 [Myxococcales bacterium]|nr:hypothetical protein [Myxococcales bacterium]
MSDTDPVKSAPPAPEDSEGKDEHLDTNPELEALDLGPEPVRPVDEVRDTAVGVPAFDPEALEEALAEVAAEAEDDDDAHAPDDTVDGALDGDDTDGG